ncbi:hypothetical protein Hamer_G020958 [Homarus americanus]|uniref:Uncharacterized protein n=1 Tax=Homarus americanus TaxID=6706 RepID=A0A8J5MPT1_HOMAM|nr:hypothetical protein Hamer_G020958 [Homarus americanus]
MVGSVNQLQPSSSTTTATCHHAPPTPATISLQNNYSDTKNKRLNGTYTCGLNSYSPGPGRDGTDVLRTGVNYVVSGYQYHLLPALSSSAGENL